MSEQVPEVPRGIPEPTRYGVIIDSHRQRQDGGVPMFFDGWYFDRAEALQALNHRLQQSPGAFGYIVREELFQTYDDDEPEPAFA